MKNNLTDTNSPTASPFARHRIEPGIMELSLLGAAAAGAPEAKPDMTIKVLLADDHPVVRSGIRQCIDESSGMRVVGEAGTGWEVFAFLKRSNCDILVLDIGLPDKSGLAVLKILKKTHPELPVLILTTFSAEQFSHFCMRAGAAGFLNKSSIASHLVAAIRQAARGDRCQPALAGDSPAAVADSAPVAPPHEALSKLEFQIFCQIALGKTRAAIATELGLSRRQLSISCTRILRIMRMAGNDEIASYALPQYLFT